MKFAPIAELTRSYCWKNGFELWKSQQSILDFVDAGIKWRNTLAEQDMRLNDPIFCYMGQRAGQTTLWHFVNRALEGSVLTVYLTRKQMQHQARGQAHAFPDDVGVEHAMPQSELFSTVLRPDQSPTIHFQEQFKYRYVIFDCGLYGMNKAPDWWRQWNATLRALEEKAVIVVVS